MMMKLFVSIIIFFFLQIFITKLKKDLNQNLNSNLLSIDNEFLIIVIFCFLNLLFFYFCFINNILFIILMIYYFNNILSIFFRFLFIKVFFIFFQRTALKNNNYYFFFLKQFFGPIIYLILHNIHFRFLIYIFLLKFSYINFFFIIWILILISDFYSLGNNFFGNFIVLRKNLFNDIIVLTPSGLLKREFYFKSMLENNISKDFIFIKAIFMIDFYYEESYLNYLTKNGFN